MSRKVSLAYFKYLKQGRYLASYNRNWKTVHTLHEVQDDLIETKEEVIVAKSYLEDKSITSTLNPTDYNITLRANLSNTSLQANTFGHATQVIDPNRKLLAVSQSLIRTDSSGFYVYFLNDKNTVKKQYCKLGGITASGLITINSGLQTGAKLIISNPNHFRTGEIVKGLTQ